MRTALDILQQAFVESLPTAEDVVSKRAIIEARDCVLILKKDGEWKAFGPYPTAEIEWHRLPKEAHVYAP